MYMHKPRGLNHGESYACARMAVRKCFDQADLTVFWGEKRSYALDARRAPKIDGFVVSSLSVNRNPANGRCVLNFYIISDEAYGDRQKKLFEEACLPRMREWLGEKAPQSSKAELLVSWTGSSFRLQEIHFQ